jgi:hypothetical protein
MHIHARVVCLVKKHVLLSGICLLLLVSLVAVPVLAQTVTCPSSCSCLLPAEAKKLGYPGYCLGKQAVCGIDMLKNEKYCYAKPVTTTTAVPQLIITARQFVTTTPTSLQVPAACPSACSCFTLADGKQQGLGLCGDTKTLCGFGANQQPQYCHATAVALPSPAGADRAGITVTGTPPVIVQGVPRVPVSDEEASRVAAVRRCTIAGRITGFTHNSSSLRVRFTPENGDPSEVYVFAESGPIDAVVPVHTFFHTVPCTSGTYDIEPVFVPDDNVCPWSGTFTPARITGILTTGSSVTGQDFTFARADTRAPEVEISFTPPEPEPGEAASLTIRGRDDSPVTALSGTAEWRYNDGTVKIFDMDSLEPHGDPVRKSGDLPGWSDTIPFGAPWYVNLERVIIDAKACDAAGNEGRGSGTFIAGSCTDNYLNRDEEQIDCGGTWCAPCIPCTWCGPHVTPLHISGTTEDKIDVVFVPEIDYGGDTAQFVRDIQNTIINGYYRNDAIEQNRTKFNFYYLDDEADVTAYPASGFTPPLGSCDDFQDATSFADSLAVTHKTEFRDWSGTRCERRVFCSEPTSYRTFVHESGHSVFGLKDEYCCDSSYAQQDVVPNIWSSRENCRNDATAMGWDPDDCDDFCTAGTVNCGTGFWDIDPPHCIMACSQSCALATLSGCGTGTSPMCQYEQACLRRVNYVFGQYV